MSASDPTELERLEALSVEVEALAVRIATRAKAFGPEIDARARLGLVCDRLRVALDELSAYPARADEITDE